MPELLAHHERDAIDACGIAAGLRPPLRHRAVLRHVEQLVQVERRVVLALEREHVDERRGVRVQGRDVRRMVLDALARLLASLRRSTTRPRAAPQQVLRRTIADPQGHALGDLALERSALRCATTRTSCALGFRFLRAIDRVRLLHRLDTLGDTREARLHGWPHRLNHTCSPSAGTSARSHTSALRQLRAHADAAR